MKKKISLITTLVTLSIVALGLVSCRDTNKYTVSFNSYGGSVIANREVEKGQSLDLPTVSKADYDFGGWYDNSALSGDVLSSPYTPSSDITLFAEWTLHVPPTTYTVTFMNGEEVFYTTQVEEGQAATAPTDKPVKKATAQYKYTFKYWDKAFDNIMGNLVVNAVFAETLRSYMVTFMNGEEVFSTQTVKYGEQAKVPSTNPTKPITEDEVFTFQGWYIDSNTTKLYNFETPISGIVKLYAGYTGSPRSSLEYILNEDGQSYTVKGPTFKVIKTAVIPTTYKNLPVTGISQGAFKDCSSLTSITLPFIGEKKDGTDNNTLGYIFDR